MTKKVLVVVVFLLVLFIVAVEVNKRVIEKGLPKVEGPDYSLRVNNYPGGIVPLESFLKVVCHVPVCSYAERNFTWAIVEKIDGHNLQLNLYNEKIEAYVKPDADYKVLTYFYKYRNYKNLDETLELVEGDHFNEILVQDFIGLGYDIDSAGKVQAHTVVLVKKVKTA